jgi:hypothetical protein
MKKRIPTKDLLALRHKLAAGVAPEALLRFVKPYGGGLQFLKELQANVTRDGPGMIRFGGSIEIKHSK